MHRVTIAEAAGQLAELVREAAEGQDVVLTDGDREVAKIVRATPPAVPLPKPVFGSARGLITIAPDFDDPIPGFEDYTA